MANPHRTVGTPQPWVETIRRHWSDAHTVEIHHRTSPRGTWLAVPKGHLVLPELVDEDEDEEDEEESDEEESDEDATPTREGPEGAAETARIMFRRAWAHFETLDRKRAWYQLTVYRIEGGTLVELEHTTVGGALKDDGSVDLESWDEQTDHERERSIQDWALGEAKTAYKMLMDVIRVHVDSQGSVTSLVTETLKARADVATKHLEHEQVKMDAAVSMERARQTGETAREYGERFGPALNLWAAAYHAQHTAPRGQAREPHPNTVVESARNLLDELDGEAIAHLMPILGGETTSDVLSVLRLALEEEPDPSAIAAGWLAIAPALFRFQAKLADELPPELARRLTAALQAFHLAASA